MPLDVRGSRAAGVAMAFKLIEAAHPGSPPGLTTAVFASQVGTSRSRLSPYPSPLGHPIGGDSPAYGASRRGMSHPFL